MRGGPELDDRKCQCETRAGIFDLGLANNNPRLTQYAAYYYSTQRMVKEPQDSSLNFAIIGLLWQESRSGYDLRKFFASTPMISFSDSPGAIYPALQRLERRGLVRGTIEGTSGRGRKTFAATVQGRSEFKRWQTKAITRHDIIRNTNSLMLRFAFMDQFATKAAALRFLRDFSKGLEDYLPSLQAFLQTNGKFMPQSGRLAMESGIQAYETQLRWVKTAQASYGRTKGKGR
jgi:DNA-binding PadR family transcriptional regulator